MVGFITIFGFVMRRSTHWRLWEFIVGGLAVLLVVLLASPLFASVAGRADALIQLREVVEAGLYFLCPWLLGYGLGSISLIAAREQRPIDQRTWMIATAYAICGVFSSALLGTLSNFYGSLGVHRPAVTQILIRFGPAGWLFATFALAGLIVWKDLSSKRSLGNALASSFLILALAMLFLPLIGIFSQSTTP